MFILVFAWLTLAGHFATVQFCDGEDSCNQALADLAHKHSDALDTSWAVLQPDLVAPAAAELKPEPAQPKGSI